MAWARETTTGLGAALRVTEAPAIAVGAVQGDDRATAVEPEVHTGDRFEIGSIGKTMTATVLARLVLDGKMSLDDPVSSWLDGGDNGGITIGALASHVSGLPRLAPNAHSHAGYTGEDPYALFGAELAEEGLRAAAPEAPGTYSYSNFGYQLIGICLERTTGKSLDELFRHHIFDPLDMAGAVVHPDAGALQGHDSEGHPVANWNVLLPGPGGVNATIADLVAYAAAVAAAPEGPLGDAFALAMEPRAEGPGAKIGLGWVLHPAGIACHGGGTFGFSSYVAVHRASGRGVAALLNRHASEAVEQAALAAALGRNPEDVVPRPYDGDPSGWNESAHAFAREFVDRDFEAARARMHPETAAALTVDRLAGGWTALCGPLGALGEPRPASVARLGQSIRVTLTIPGETGELTMHVSYLDDGQVVGVLLR